MRFLNLGCGTCFSTAPEWVNVDMYAADPAVIVHNLTQGIPYPDNHFDLVYHSHVLEHFDKEDGIKFLKECQRVLRPKGTIRIAVPDLENNAKRYLNSLETVLENNTLKHASAYDWSMLELYDQTIRQKSGGQMLAFIESANKDQLEVLQQRLGSELQYILDAIEKNKQHPVSPQPPSKLRQWISNIKHPSRLKETILKILLGDEYSALEVGRFRKGGEIHLWMYDRYSLAQTLKSVGFVDPIVQSADQSSVDTWSDYHLDTDEQHAIRKPDSMYMEAIATA